MDSARLDCRKMLSEAAIDVDPSFALLSEEAKIQVTDDALTGMMKFITEKYNQLDFAEIERSAGDIDKFKYSGMIWSNAETLEEIYKASDDPGAKRYLEVCQAIRMVHVHLKERRQQYVKLYQSGNGLVQILYTSLVASMIYSTGILVANTIRFVTTERGTDCEVLYDEIPGSIKNVHLKNILAAASDISKIEELLDAYSDGQSGKALKESVSIGTVAAAILGTGFVLILIPRIISLIREIIYSIYYFRVKLADMIGVEVDLINTNIESLEATGRSSKKVIARQRKIAEKLSKWQSRIAVKTDSVNTLVLVQKKGKMRNSASPETIPSPGNPDPREPVP